MAAGGAEPDPGERSAVRALLGCFGVLVGVALALVAVFVRLGVITAAYAGAALAGGSWVVWSQWGQPANVVVALSLLGAGIVPLALTLGFVAWLVPSFFRLMRAWPNTEDFDPTPAHVDALALLAVTLGVTLAGAAVLSGGGPGAIAWFALTAAASVGVIVVTGGRHVALIWLQLLR